MEDGKSFQVREPCSLPAETHNPNHSPKPRAPGYGTVTQIAKRHIWSGL